MRVDQMKEVRLHREWIRYYLLRSGRKRQSYGICVTYRGEAVVLPGITCSETEAKCLLRRMVQGKVTPVTARDIVEDWLCGR